MLGDLLISDWTSLNVSLSHHSLCKVQACAQSQAGLFIGSQQSLSYPGPVRQGRTVGPRGLGTRGGLSHKNKAES